MKVKKQITKIWLYVFYSISLMSYLSLFFNFQHWILLACGLIVHPILLAILVFPFLENSVFIKIKDKAYWSAGYRGGLSGFVLYFLILAIHFSLTYLLVILTKSNIS